MSIHDIRDPPFLVLRQKAFGQWEHGGVFTVNVFMIEGNENPPTLDKLFHEAGQAEIILFRLKLAIENLKPLSFGLCFPMLLLYCLDWGAVEVGMNNRSSLKFWLEDGKQPVFFVSCVQRHLRMKELKRLPNILLLSADSLFPILFQIEECTLEDPQVSQDFFVTLDELPEWIYY